MCPCAHSHWESRMGFYQTGERVRAGKFRCAGCGVDLKIDKDGERLPECPCGSRSYEGHASLKAR